MVIKVRRFELSDLKELMNLDKIAHKEIKWWGLETEKELKKLYTIDRNMLWVAEDKGKLVGFLIGDVIKRINLIGKEGRIPEIASIYVPKSYRRKGVASKLIKAFEMNLKPKYFSRKKRYIIISAVSNLGHKLFKNYGFKEDVHWLRKKV